MRLKLPTIYSQRDQRWSSSLLGYNKNQPYTIGNFGCLITCLGCLVNKNPTEVNDILKANNGFVNGGLFVWSKSSILGLTEIYKSPLYSGPVTNQGIGKIKSLLDEGHAVLTHVDFNPATTNDDMHWVLILGYDEPENFTIFDPWTGTITRLDVYGDTRKTIYEFRAYEPKLSIHDPSLSVSILKSQFEELVRNSTISHKVAEILKKEINLDVIVGELQRLVKLEDQIVEKDRKISELQSAHDELHAQLVSVTAKHVALQDLHEETQTKLAEATQSSDALKKAMESQKNDIDSLTANLEALEKLLKDDTAIGLIVRGIAKLFGR